MHVMPIFNVVNHCTLYMWWREGSGKWKHIKEEKEKPKNPKWKLKTEQKHKTYDAVCRW